MEQRDTFVYILMSILSFAVFIKFKSQNNNNPFFIFHFYNSKSITLIENIKVLYLYRLVDSA